MPTSKDKDIRLKEQPGYTGTAHALLQGGVPSVVAMRYAVGDDYARDLGVEFYRALLAHTQPKDAAAALTMARQLPARCPETRPLPLRRLRSRHAGALWRRAARPDLAAEGRSPALDRRAIRRLHQIAELTPASRAFRGAHLGTGRAGRGLHRLQHRGGGEARGR